MSFVFGAEERSSAAATEQVNDAPHESIRR